jgi:hypothetical protein
MFGGGFVGLCDLGGDKEEDTSVFVDEVGDGGCCCCSVAIKSRRINIWASICAVAY